MMKVDDIISCDTVYSPFEQQNEGGYNRISHVEVNNVGANGARTGDTVTLFFESECGDNWNLIFRFHKGQTLVEAVDCGCPRNDITIKVNNERQT